MRDKATWLVEQFSRREYVKSQHKFVGLQHREGENSNRESWVQSLIATGYLRQRLWLQRQAHLVSPPPLFFSENSLSMRERRLHWKKDKREINDNKKMKRHRYTNSGIVPLALPTQNVSNNRSVHSACNALRFALYSRARLISTRQAGGRSYSQQKDSPSFVHSWWFWAISQIGQLTAIGHA